MFVFLIACERQTKLLIYILANVGCNHQEDQVCVYLHQKDIPAMARGESRLNKYNWLSIN